MERDVDTTIGKVRPMLYTLAKLRHYVHRETSVTIYKAYIILVLEFGLYLIDNNRLIEKLQKNAK